MPYSPFYNDTETFIREFLENFLMIPSVAWQPIHVSEGFVIYRGDVWARFETQEKAIEILQAVGFVRVEMAQDTFLPAI